MAFTKAKIVMAGLAVTAVCIVAPQQLKAQCNLTEYLTKRTF